jgi:hypothetical protein
MFKAFYRGGNTKNIWDLKFMLNHSTFILHPYFTPSTNFGQGFGIELLRSNVVYEFLRWLKDRQWCAQLRVCGRTHGGKARASSFPVESILQYSRISFDCISAFAKICWRWVNRFVWTSLACITLVRISSDRSPGVFWMPNWYRKNIARLEWEGRRCAVVISGIVLTLYGTARVLTNTRKPEKWFGRPLRTDRSLW